MIFFWHSNIENIKSYKRIRHKRFRFDLSDEFRNKSRLLFWRDGFFFSVVIISYYTYTMV